MKFNDDFLNDDENTNEEKPVIEVNGGFLDGNENSYKAITLLLGRIAFEHKIVWLFDKIYSYTQTVQDKIWHSAVDLLMFSSKEEVEPTYSNKKLSMRLDGKKFSIYYNGTLVTSFELEY